MLVQRIASTLEKSYKTKCLKGRRSTQNSQGPNISTEITDGTFEELVVNESSQKPVILHCWAPWCPHCHTLESTLVNAASTKNNSIKLTKMSVQENIKTVRELQVEALPTAFAFSHNRIVSKIVGAQKQEKVDEFIQKLLDAHNDGRPQI